MENNTERNRSIKPRFSTRKPQGNFRSKKATGWVVLTTSLLFVIKSNGQNLVTNGSFSNQGNNWTFFAPATGTEAYATETTYGGTNATNNVAEVDYGANLRQANIPVIPVIPGQTYWFSFRHSRRTAGGAPNPTTVEVKIYDGTNTFLDQTILSTNTTWDWQCETYQFTPTSNTVTLDLGNLNSTSTLGTIVDDLTITPVVQTIDLNGIACQGSDITLNAPNFPNDPNQNYSDFSWTEPNGSISSTNANISLNNLQPSDSGIYTCNMTLNGCLSVTGTYHLSISVTNFNRVDSICEGNSYNFYGRELTISGVYDTLIPASGNSCDSNIILNLKVIPNPIVQITPNGKTSICQGDTVLVQLNPAENDVAYQWFQNGNPIAGANGTSLTVNQAGIFYVYGTRNGCIVRSQNLNVTLYPSPTANIQTAHPSLCAFDTLTLIANYDPNNQYNWEPASVFSEFLPGQEGGSEITGRFRDPETKVVLTVTNSFGCVSQTTLSVPTQPCCEVFIPNAFSPNNDGKNDYFIPVLRGGQQIKTFHVFNRYGQIVYSYATGKIGWDGTFGDKPADLGIYFYNLIYQCSDGQIYQKKGSLSLVR